MGVIDKLGKKLDSRMMGVVFGIGLTIIGFVVFWQWKHGDKSFGELYHHLYWRWDKFTTGLVAVTIVLTVIIALLILM